MARSRYGLLLPVFFVVLLVCGCGDVRDPSAGEPAEGNEDPGSVTSALDAIEYMDDLAAHPGCTLAELPYAPASIPGFPCAAKAYLAVEDTTKPIILLVHGNSDGPDVWERFPLETGSDMLAERLSNEGHRVYAVDMRMDQVCNLEPCDNLETENAARNMDHGWGVPIVQRLIRSVMQAYPQRRVFIVAHSFGVTVVRDALRRLLINEKLSPFSQLAGVIYAAGANHGVSSWQLCNTNPTMRGKVVCQMGNRDNFSPTEFLKGLNGPDGSFEVPCSDGDSAFGQHDVCGGNKVVYTTMVMRDIAQGTYQDKFVSEASSSLRGADNQLIELEDFDTSEYFYKGLFKNHYGPVRNEKALQIILQKVQ